MPSPNRHSRFPCARATGLVEWLETSGDSYVGRRTVLAPNPAAATSIKRLIEWERLSLLGVQIMTLTEVLDDLGSIELIHGQRRMGPLDALTIAHAALAPVAPNIASHPASLCAVAAGLRSQRNGRVPARPELLAQLPGKVHGAWMKGSEQFVSDLELVETAAESYWTRLGKVLWIVPPSDKLELRVAAAIRQVWGSEVLADSTNSGRWQIFEAETAREEASRIVSIVVDALAEGAASAAIVVPSLGSEISIAIEQAAAVRGLRIGGFCNSRLADIPSLWDAFLKLDLPSGGALSVRAGAAIFRAYAQVMAECGIPRYAHAIGRAQRELDESATLIMAIDGAVVSTSVVRARITQILERWIESGDRSVQLLPLAQAADGLHEVVHLAGATADVFDAASDRVEQARALLTRAGQATCSFSAVSVWKGTAVMSASFTRDAPSLPARSTSPSSSLIRETHATGRDDEIGMRVHEIDRASPSAWNGFVGPGEWLREKESPSALARYAVCPFKYFLTTTLGLTTIEDREGWSPSERGTVIHRILERAVKDVELRSEEATGVSTSLDTLRSALEAAVVREWADVLADPNKAPALARQRSELASIERSIEHFVSFEEEIRDEGFTQLIGAEYDLGRFDVPGMGMAVTGTVDRIVATESKDAIKIIDYKTGSREYFKLNPDDITQMGQHLQLAMYGLALQAEFPESEITCEYWFLGANDAKRDCYTLDSVVVERIQFVLATLIAGIQSGFFVPKPEAPQYPSVEWCGQCDVSQFCAIRRRRTWDSVGSIPDEAVQAVVQLIGNENGAE